MKIYVERAMHLMRKLYPYLTNCGESVRRYEYALDKFNKDYHYHIRLCHGASRIVLICGEFVIKFDYCESEVSRIGGCENEMKFYEFAQFMHKSYLFAEITRIHVGHKYFYVMPYVHGVGSSNDYVEYYLDEDDCEFIQNYLYDTHEYNFGWEDDYPVIIDYAANVILDGVELTTT